MRVPIALVLIAVLVAAAAFVADHPGRVDIVWQGWEVETSVGVLAAALTVVVVVLIAIGGILRRLIRLPRILRRRRRERRRRAGYAALTSGFAAIAAGDPPRARQAARRAALLLDEVPLTLALSAQAAQLDGDADTARHLMTAMLDRPETLLFGLRGLYVDAIRAGDDAAALTLAERARRLRPDLAWAIEAVLALQLRTERWDAARDTLADAARRHVIPPERARHHRGTLLLESSRAAERRGERRQALSLAAQAVALTPDLADPACHQARLLIAQGRVRAARRVIERAWATAPHPELARLHAGLQPDATPLARLAAAQRLAAVSPEAEESHVAVADAALDARLWGEARRHLVRAVETAPTPGPSRRLCRLMARLEESEHADAAGGREWLERAVATPADPRYVCAQCGGECAERPPLCPHCGAFDTLAWSTDAPPPPFAAPTPLLPAPSDLAALR